MRGQIGRQRRKKSFIQGVGFVSAQERLDLTDKQARMGVEMAEQPEPMELSRLSVCWLVACVMD